MKESRARRTVFLVLGLISVGVVSRLIPHLPNATPLNALTNVARTHLGFIPALIVPLLTLILTDAVIGFYDWRILISVYSSFVLCAALSRYAPVTKSWSVLTYPLVASLSFFLITNGAVWAFSPWYERSMLGLLTCYTAGLPFLKFMLVGDILYTAGAYITSDRRALWRARYARMVPEHQPRSMS